MAAAVALAILLNTEGGSHKGKQNSAAATHRSHASHPTTNTAGTNAAGSASTATSAAGSTATSTSASTPAAEPAAQATGSPDSAVESFYGLAASHRYANAWALADPTFRSQLGGYQSFQSGQQGDRSITFNSAHVVSQTSSSATVAIKTTSVRTDGTHHCAGTVDLRPGASSGQWLLHLIQINCT